MKEQGLINKYYIQKRVVVEVPERQIYGKTYPPTEKTIFAPVDPRAEYFVLRLDKDSKDKKHLEACRKAVLVYANEIKEHLPQLSKDLIERYGNDEMEEHY